MDRTAEGRSTDDVTRLKLELYIRSKLNDDWEGSFANESGIDWGLCGRYGCGVEVVEVG